MNNIFLNTNIAIVCLFVDTKLALPLVLRNQMFFILDQEKNWVRYTDNTISVQTFTQFKVCDDW